MSKMRAVVVEVLLHVSILAVEAACTCVFPIELTHSSSTMFVGRDTVASFRFQLHRLLPLMGFFGVLWFGQELCRGR